jgi:serine/threonine-protein kinase
VQFLGPLAPEEACDYVRQTASGLAHAHDRGLVHRDIKPGNLLLTTQEMVVKILDMGLVCLRHSAGADLATVLTTDGAMVGTPDFVAPEQLSDAHTVDNRADLYSLGCTFYYLLTGRPPFVAATVPEKLLMHCSLEPEPVQRVQPKVPPRVAAVVHRLMAKRPADRYLNATQVAAELAPLCAP